MPAFWQIGQGKEAFIEPNHFCHACFSGDYPTPVDEGLVQLRHMSPMLATGV